MSELSKSEHANLIYKKVVEIQGEAPKLEKALREGRFVDAAFSSAFITQETGVLHSLIYTLRDDLKKAEASSTSDTSTEVPF